MAKTPPTFYSYSIVTLNLSRLNENQKRAVLHGDGPLLVLAGAGSGKTSTMSYRIAHLVAQRGVSASSILGLSFTRKAAEELRERVKGLITKVAGVRAAHGLTVTTFHSLCARILRAHAEKVGYSRNFTIMDRSDQVDVLRQILRNINVDDRKFDPDVLLFEFGQAKNRFLGPAQAESFFFDSGKLANDYAIVAHSCFGRYQEQLKALSAMDFDDLLFSAVTLLENSPEVRADYNQKFQYILVDEYQDTNPAQSRLLKLLTESKQNICVVGDDDQSIYAWRGADPTHILNFGEHYPGARVLTLDQNYRSTTTILNAANEVIGKNRNRHPKSLWSDRGEGEPIEMIMVDGDRAEGEVVAEEILKRAREVNEGVIRQKRPWKDFAILYRSNPQSRIFEETLRMRGIPYKIVGSMSFLNRKEIKDVLSYWKLILNPKDDSSARRILNWPSRGVGKTSLEVLNAQAVEKGISFFETLGQARDLTTKAATGVASFKTLIDKMRTELETCEISRQGLALWAKRSLELIGVKQGFEQDSDDAKEVARKMDSVDELANAVGQMNLADILSSETEAGGVATNGLDVLREFIIRMTLDSIDEAERDEEKQELKDQVTLLTLHGAKGLEYPIVFLVGMEEGLLPHRRVIEECSDLSEERRLCYVGITRARDHLILTRAKSRIRYGKEVPRNPSRFLEEIPANLLITRNESSTPDLSSKEACEKHEAKVKDYLGAIRAQLMANKK
ncbi:UvrD-helicase domain-containing protein [Bdellovibrionota bacterium FG-2]